jgi:hypothetical protein
VARNGRRAGAVLVMCAVLVVCAVVVVAGCAGHGPASSPDRPAAAQTLSQQQAAHRYLVIAEAGNRRLDTDFGRLAGKDRARLGAANADLADAAATERLFDRRLSAIAFAPAAEAAARLLYRLNQARAGLTATAATSVTLAQLRGWQRRLSQSNAEVEQAVRVLRSQLGLPPPSTS